MEPRVLRRARHTSPAIPRGTPLRFGATLGYRDPAIARFDVRNGFCPHERAWEEYMPDSVYKVIELVGTSTKSWEDAAKNAVDRAAKSLRDLRVAEVIQLDMVLDNGKVEAYRAKINVSFKYEGGG
jgi:flavin-binding protein dodecin